MSQQDIYVLVSGIVLIFLALFIFWLVASYRLAKQKKRDEKTQLARKKEQQEKKERDDRNNLLTKMEEMPIETVVEICRKIGLIDGLGINLPPNYYVDEKLLARTVSSLIHHDKNLATDHLILQIEKRSNGGPRAFIGLVGLKHYDAEEALTKCLTEIEKKREAIWQANRIKEGVAAFK